MPENFAPANVERHVLRHVPPAEAPHAHEDIPPLVGHFRKQFVNVAVDHHPHQILFADILQIAAAHRLAVPQDRVPLGDLADLFQKVADVDDADPVLPQRGDDGKQSLDIVPGERTGRLIEHDDPRLHDQGPRNLDELPGTHRQVMDERPGMQVGMPQTVEHVPHPPALFAAVEETSRAGLPARA